MAESRQICTQIWRKEWFGKLSVGERLTLLYLGIKIPGPEQMTAFSYQDLVDVLCVNKKEVMEILTSLYYSWNIHIDTRPKTNDEFVRLSIFKERFPYKPIPIPSGRRQALSLKIKKAIHELYCFTCVYCGAPSEEIDHVVPVSKGGKNDRSNLVASCRPCNRHKRDKTLSELGWEIRYD